MPFTVHYITLSAISFVSPYAVAITTAGDHSLSTRVIFLTPEVVLALDPSPLRHHISTPRLHAFERHLLGPRPCVAFPRYALSGIIFLSHQYVGPSPPSPPPTQQRTPPAASAINVDAAVPGRRPAEFGARVGLGDIPLAVTPSGTARPPRLGNNLERISKLRRVHRHLDRPLEVCIRG